MKGQKKKNGSRSIRMKAKKEGRQAVKKSISGAGKKPSNYKTKVKVKKKK